jgi:integral membrane protein
MTLERTTTQFLIIGKWEGYSYLILIFIAMPLKYIFAIPEFVKIFGSIHGLLFVIFIILLAILKFKYSLSFKLAFYSFMLSLLPFGTFYLAKLFDKK